ncbi:MAG: protein-L-isoaspartate(D-aspartate) O-methyltransferase [Sulfolobales archaeon]|nr:protein-L-isoaspartate(D-aspartate) O-methyltransferase [Sulfolobales archaeon]MDW8010636.1 protein-L-isoaspartate(D-aspartate) O-methyltransferase [Sulfolobales archaeon]
MGGRIFEEERRRVVRSLIAEGYLRTQAVVDAMLRVPREEFVLPEYRRFSYYDTPLPIGCGQTISAPHMVATMTEKLEPRPGQRVLEVGTGSGYQAAILAEVVGPRGHVWTIERIPQLAEYALNNLRRTKYLDRVTVVVGDGSEGYPPAAPYDRVIVTAAAPDIPKPLVDQLEDGGRLVIPVGSRWIQVLKVVVKEGGRVRVERDIPCVFVPLVGKYGFKEVENRDRDIW